MPKTDETFTTLKVSKRNLKRLFCLKLDPTDTYDTVITRLLDANKKEKQKEE